MNMHSQPDLQAPARSVVERAILMVLPSLEGQPLPEHLHLEELGADSIDRIEIISACLHDLDLKVPLSEFSAVPNVAALIEKLDQLARSAA